MLLAVILLSLCLLSQQREIVLVSIDANSTIVPNFVVNTVGNRIVYGKPDIPGCVEALFPIPRLLVDESIRSVVGVLSGFSLGEPDAFEVPFGNPALVSQSLNEDFLDGISITYLSANGVRNEIFSFASANNTQLCPPPINFGFIPSFVSLQLQACASSFDQFAFETNITTLPAGSSISIRICTDQPQNEESVFIETFALLGRTIETPVTIGNGVANNQLAVVIGFSVALSFTFILLVFGIVFFWILVIKKRRIRIRTVEVLPEVGPSEDRRSIQLSMDSQSPYHAIRDASKHYDVATLRLKGEEAPLLVIQSHDITKGEVIGEG
jgi:hypothetical protein